MTLEEYLNKRIKQLQTTPYITVFVVDKIIVYREILSELSEFDHDVTLKEVKEMCQSHFGKDGCEKCPMHATAVDCPALDCSVFNVPTRWEPDAIQKRMKEARK